MNRLQAELQRLYFVHHLTSQDAGTETPGLSGPDGRVRGMVLELARPADWQALSTVWHAVQAVLGLPAPAIAVNGVDGYQLWFSLQTPMPIAEALAFLDALRLRYLGHVAAGRVAMMPVADASASAQPGWAGMVPALRAESGRWSAFVARDLAAVFADDPWLDLCPSSDAQTDVLSRLDPIQSEDFKAAQNQLSHVDGASISHATSITDAKIDLKDGLGSTGSTQLGKKPGPRQFLLDVMSDPSIDLHLRIEVAKALLPHVEG